MIEELVFIFSAIITYGLGKISKKLKWNENLPIPIQNILVGFVVFGIVILYQKSMGEAIDVQVTMHQIFSALSGSGMATLVYDANKSVGGGK